MSGGGGVSHAQNLEIDQGALAKYMTTQEGQQFAKMYNPGNAYATVGDSIQAYDPDQYKQHFGTTGNGQANVADRTEVGPDVSGMIKAFQAWQAGNAQTQANWQNYTNLVNANAGGEGDNSIITGVAQGQRTQLLGSLANAGNPTVPTPGLGSMGTLTQNGKAIQ